MNDSNPWGSLRNKALDALGLWEWNGVRGVDGTPYRWKLHYQCACRVLRHTANAIQPDGPFCWASEAPDRNDSGYCPYCVQPKAAYDAEDLLLDVEICPFSEDD